ncbi:MAG: peptidylprolyl isomerase [Bryobacteraceae bacterium]|jgi:parvulin-like peptidyl-prolyl isomerase
MKALIPSLFLCLGTAWAQTAAPPPAPAPKGPPALPDLPEKTVIAVFDDGTPFTMGELKAIFAVLPPEAQQNAIVQRRAFVQQWALMRKLALMAEKDKIDQESPAKEQLLYSRWMILSQLKLSSVLNSTSPSEDEIAKFYEASKDRYKQVRVKAIYIAFGGAATDGKQTLTEDEAKGKAAKLLAQIRAGADFVKLVKENSDDETSRDKDGDFATLHTRDNIPDAIRAAVFALKQGETSEPVRQPNGFYLLRADEVAYSTLDQVRLEVVSELRQQQYAKWLADTNNGVKVQFPDPAFPGDGQTGK